MGSTYPASADAADSGKGLAKSSGTNFQYTQLSSGAGYCLTATSDRSGVGPFSISSGSGMRNGVCSGHDYGYVAPAGVNIAAPITTWTLPASVSVNGDAIQFPAVSGGYVSTLLKVDEAKSVLISFDSKALATGSRSVWSSDYYASNKTTSVKNTGGYTGNGCAYSGTTVGVWEGKSCYFALGPGIIYLRLYLSTTSTYSGPTEIRNVSVTLTR